MSDEKIQQTDKKWMSKAEVRIFNEAVKDGKISFFRIAYCAVCKSQVPASDSKMYCSEECYVKDGNEPECKKTPEDDDDQW